MAAGMVDDKAVTLGVRYLARTQAEDGFWKEERFTATGFPRVFYLRYHGYAKYFPLWAMARYRNLKKATGIRCWWECDRLPRSSPSRASRRKRGLSPGRESAPLRAAGMPPVLKPLCMRPSRSRLPRSSVLASRAGWRRGSLRGSKLIARTVIAEDGARYYGDPVWSKRLSSALGGATIADIAGVDAPVAGHEEKHALHLKTGAHAADMESHIAAR